MKMFALLTLILSALFFWTVLFLRRKLLWRYRGLVFILLSGGYFTIFFLICSRYGDIFR